ncbi:MAG TPA: PKD domain-containing protein [Polyangia bacterium]|nr:PKD domain-containing protein [Polyangia bacterium]
MAAAPRLMALGVLVGVLVSGRASAITLNVMHSGPSVVGEAHAFTASVPDAKGTVTFQWQFSESDDFQSGGPEMSHTYAAPGLYSVQVNATDSTGDSASVFFRHLVHYPLTDKRPTSSTSIVFDAARNRIYSVNQDNDTITAVDADGLKKIAEVAVYRRPEALALTPQGKLWVVHQDDYAVAVIDPDRLAVERGFRLPYASQPVGVAMSPTGDAAYITLMATGKLLKLDPQTGDVRAQVDVGARPRGIAVSHDGRDVYVTRFISSDDGGEVVKVDAGAMTVATRVLLKTDTTTVDDDQKARGVPNFLFSIALTPDGRQAWVPGKKDNILRGKLRDGQDITHDTIVRPLTAVVDLATAREIYENRIDLDNRSMPMHVELSPYGNFAILTLGFSNRIEVRDVNRPTQVFSAIANVGELPRASVLAPNGRLFVQGSLSRDILVYDLTSLLNSFDASTPPLVATIPAVAAEKLPPQVLAGKKIFHDASDERMDDEGYISCGSCHFEGIEDGRTYDFSTRGEGLRNTVALLGRKGVGQGRLNWAATLDEVQDFEHQIRELFKGRGFIPDDVFHVGTRDQPLGDPKAGLSPELDALAAYVTSLDRVNPSPYRNQDGSLTDDGVAGRALFDKLGCDFCHGGSEMTDSARGQLHDVGTITALSGSRAGGPLLGFDTPTLLGVWETAPYLHDGSAPTLRDVLTTKNPNDLHGYVSSLSAKEVDQLVAYLLQIDDQLPPEPLPFESGPGGGKTTGGHPSSVVAGCSCAVPGGRGDRGASLLLLVIALMTVRPRRGRRQAARRSPVGRAATLSAAVAAVALAGLGCTKSPSGQSGEPRQPTDWSKLPATPAADPELERFGTRQSTWDRVCGRRRGDPFAGVLCGGGRRPEIRDIAELLELVGLADDRAFALTGNSTSLLAREVSALNPRLLVFPRVGDDLRRPDKTIAVGFVRGEQLVELAGRDPATGDINFYLLTFEQPCNATSAGCDLASLLTEEIEHGWTAYSVYDQDDLEGTSLDCNSCHQPDGYGTKRILRMQELASPWLHWFPQRFVQRTDSDRVLLGQFTDTHRDEEQYGGIPIDVIGNALDQGSGAQLEAFVRAEGFGDQPNPFDAQIVTEMKTGDSPTWDARFQTHLQGQAIPVPYPAIDVTDQAKRSAAVRSFQDVVRGAAPRAGLADIRDVFSQDATEKLSFVPQPGADGKTVLLQMCARCHDGRGNPQLSKNGFNVRSLDTLPRGEKDLAIARINDTSRARMPPWRVGALTADSIRAATAELQK